MRDIIGDEVRASRFRWCDMLLWLWRERINMIRMWMLGIAEEIAMHCTHLLHGAPDIGNSTRVVWHTCHLWPYMMSRVMN